MGIFYGFSHQRTITATQKKAHDQQAYDNKQKLIDQAKAEFQRQKNPQKTSGDDGTSRAQHGNSLTDHTVNGACR